MLSAVTAHQMDQLHMNMNEPGLPQTDGFKHLILPSPNDMMGSYVPLTPQLLTHGPFNHSLPYLAWLQGVQSALMAMTSSVNLTEVHSHSNLLKFSPLTLSGDLSNHTNSDHLTNLPLDNVCTPVSRSTPILDSNSIEDPDKPLALVVRKYTETDRLQPMPIELNLHRDPSPNNISFSSSISTTSSTESSSSRDTLHTRTSHNHHRPRPKLTNRDRSQARRMKANARERSRVHTISAAFEALRQIVPNCPTTPKLSKLSVLRVASCYIDALRTCLHENPLPNVDKSDSSDNDR